MSFTMTSPFAAISGDQIEGLAASSPDGKIPEDDLVLEGFTGDSGSVYEVGPCRSPGALHHLGMSDCCCYARSPSSLFTAAMAHMCVFVAAEQGRTTCEVVLHRPATSLQQAVTASRRQQRFTAPSQQTRSHTIFRRLEPYAIGAHLALAAVKRLLVAPRD